MTTTAKRIRVYRFHDTVALAIGDSKTLYIGTRLAGELQDAIDRTVHDIEAVKFTDSTLPTIENEV